MAIKTFATGEVLTASDTNTFLANSGLVYVTSTTVGTGVSSVTVSNCFTSTYDNYRITVSGITGGASNVFIMQMTASGTPSTTSYAGNTFYIATGGAGGLTNAALSTYFEVGGSGGKVSFGWDVYQPAVAAYTYLSFGNADENYFRFGHAVHKVNTAYDGFKFAQASSTFTGGTITVYGYRKA